MVLSGEKTIVSRWSMNKVAPFEKVNVGDEILLKEFGKDVTATAIVKDVQYYELTPEIVEEIRLHYGKLGLTNLKIGKQLCIKNIVHLYGLVM